MNAGLQAQEAKTFAPCLFFDAAKDGAAQSLAARFRDHVHTLDLTVTFRVDAQRAAGDGKAIAPGDEEADPRLRQLLEIEEVVALGWIQSAQITVERTDE